VVTREGEGVPFCLLWEAFYLGVDGKKTVLDMGFGVDRVVPLCVFS